MQTINAGACSINMGMIHKLLNGNCPKCDVGLRGHFGDIYNSVDKLRQGLLAFAPYSCPHCGYNFSNVEKDMHK